MMDYMRDKLSPLDFELIDGAQKIVEKSDLWRLLVMCHEGGMYMDIDRLINRGMGSLIGPNTRMLLPIFRGFGAEMEAFNFAQVSSWGVYCCDF